MTQTQEMLKTRVYIDSDQEITSARMYEDAVVVRFHECFYRDLIASCELRNDAYGVRIKRPRPEVNKVKLRGQVIHAVVDVIRHIANNKLPTSVGIFFAKNGSDATRVMWHKDGRATLILSRPAQVELLRTLAHMGYSYSDSGALDIHAIADKANDNSRVGEKAFFAYYVRKHGDFDNEGTGDSGTPRLMSLITLLSLANHRIEHLAECAAAAQEEA